MRLRFLSPGVITHLNRSIIDYGTTDKHAQAGILALLALFVSVGTATGASDGESASVKTDPSRYDRKDISGIAPVNRNNKG